MGIVLMDPRSPWQYAYVESLTGRLRHEPLAFEGFHTLLVTKIMAADYREHHNAHRPHPSLGYLTPDGLAREWAKANPVTHKKPGSPTGGRTPTIEVALYCRG